MFVFNLNIVKINTPLGARPSGVDKRIKRIKIIIRGWLNNMNYFLILKVGELCN